MINYSPDIQSVMVRDKRVAYFGESPTINDVVDGLGVDIAVSWLEIQIYTIEAFVGVKLLEEDSAITQLAELIMDKYGFLKLTEIAMFIARFKLGEFGKFYGTFDPMVITSGLIQFVRLRSIELDYYERKIKNEEVSKPAYPDGFTSISFYKACCEAKNKGDRSFLKKYKEFF